MVVRGLAQQYFARVFHETWPPRKSRPRSPSCHTWGRWARIRIRSVPCFEARMGISWQERTQVAHENLGDNVTYVQQKTIKGLLPHQRCCITLTIFTEIVESISPESPFGVVPQENSTYGSVVDTYDSLRSPKAGTEVFVRGDITLAVQHCLVVRSGLEKAKIKRILSHEQVRILLRYC